MDDCIFNPLPSGVILSVFVKQLVFFCIAHKCDTCGILSRKGGRFASHFAMRYRLLRTLVISEWIMMRRYINPHKLFTFGQTLKQPTHQKPLTSWSTSVAIELHQPDSLVVGPSCNEVAMVAPRHAVDRSLVVFHSFDYDVHRLDFVISSVTFNNRSQSTAPMQTCFSMPRGPQLELNLQVTELSVPHDTV